VPWQYAEAGEAGELGVSLARRIGLPACPQVLRTARGRPEPRDGTGAAPDDAGLGALGIEDDASLVDLAGSRHLNGDVPC